jgi:hypothetical protein
MAPTERVPVKVGPVGVYAEGSFYGAGVVFGALPRTLKELGNKVARYTPPPPAPLSTKEQEILDKERELADDSKYRTFAEKQAIHDALEALKVEQRRREAVADLVPVRIDPSSREPQFRSPPKGSRLYKRFEEIVTQRYLLEVGTMGESMVFGLPTAVAEVLVACGYVTLVKP